MAPTNKLPIVINTTEDLINTFGTAPNATDLENSWYSALYNTIQVPYHKTVYNTIPTPTVYTTISNQYASYTDIQNWSRMTQTCYMPDDAEKVSITDDGKTYTLSRADLLKYIGEQELVKSNATVRQMYDRYQVAVKLVRSDDNGDTGV